MHARDNPRGSERASNRACTPSQQPNVTPNLRRPMRTRLMRIRKRESRIALSRISVECQRTHRLPIGRWHPDRRKSRVKRNSDEWNGSSANDSYTYIFPQLGDIDIFYDNCDAKMRILSCFFFPCEPELYFSTALIWIFLINSSFWVYWTVDQCCNSFF